MVKVVWVACHGGGGGIGRDALEGTVVEGWLSQQGMVVLCGNRPTRESPHLWFAWWVSDV